MKRYSRLDTYILRLLGILPTYAYDLNQTLGREIGFGLDNAGPISRSLAALQRDGMVSSEWQFPEPPLNGPARKVYSLTAAGERYLESEAAQRVFRLFEARGRR